MSSTSSTKDVSSSQPKVQMSIETWGPEIGLTNIRAKCK